MCCLRCAGAPRRPASGSGLSLTIPSWHAVLSDHGEFDTDKFQSSGVDIGLRRDLTSSALPISRNPFHAGHVFRGFSGSHIATACQVARPPCTDLTGLPAIGGFYFQAFDGSVALAVAGYNYSIDWTPMLAGLSPAGMAASLAAPDPTARNYPSGFLR